MYTLLHKAVTLLSTSILAVKAVETGFILASDRCDTTSVGSGGFGDCLINASPVPETGFNCPELESPNFNVSTTDGSNTFHVTNQVFGSVCGVTQYDAYLDCDGCSNYGLYVAGDPSGTKIGFCYPVTQGGEETKCGLFIKDDWKEFAFCEIWDAPSAC